MPVSSRMLFSLSAAILVLSALCLSAEAGVKPSWEHYKRLFVSGDGRVIDYGQGHSSTSESQGYGMLLSVSYGDREVFDRIWLWTKANLSVRKDGLMAWLWGKRPNGSWEVMDYNNATDGDTLIASALLKASKKWNNGNYASDALPIIRSMRDKLAVRQSGMTFLLPGYYGFSKEDSITVNPSYLIFPAFRLFADADDREFWNTAHESALLLLDKSCMGSPCLPADWIRIKGNTISADDVRASRFGYDAIRVLLHLSWEKRPMPEGLSRVLDFYSSDGYIPRWVDPGTGSMSSRSAHAGIYAVYALAASRAGEARTGRKLLQEAEKKLNIEEREYYSYSLYLLSRIEDPF